jgi:hypothetical protein
MEGRRMPKWEDLALAGLYGLICGGGIVGYVVLVQKWF